MGTRIVRGKGPLGFVAAMASLSCKASPADVPSAGTLMVVVTTDMNVPKDMDALTLDVTVGGRSFPTKRVPLGSAGLRLPTAFSIKSDGPPGARATVRVAGFHGGVAQVLASATVPFPVEATRRVTVALSYLCAGEKSVGTGQSDGVPLSICGPGATCRGGACVPDETPTTPWENENPSLDPSMGAESGPCFDPAPCFDGLQGSLPVRTGATCILPLPLSEAGSRSVALVPSTLRLGWCGAEGRCYIPLDRGNEPGQFEDPGSHVRLPMAACEETIREVVVSSRCGTKVPTRPSCPTPEANLSETGAVQERWPQPTEPALPRQDGAPPPDDGPKDAGSNRSPTPIEQIAAGNYHTCARLRDQTVRCWGDGRNGQTQGGTARSSIPGLNGVVELVAGRSHTCARLAGGTVRCWGLNDRGQTGHTDLQGQGSVVDDVPGLSGVVGVFAGDDHTCAIVAGGRLRCWGRNDYRQTANSSPTEDIAGLSGIVNGAAGEGHTCVRFQNRRVRCWGDSQLGATGGGRLDADIEGLLDVEQLVAGSNHTCILQVEGTVRCFGNFQSNQTGGSDVRRPVPGLSGVARVDAGGNFTCVVLQSGSVRCWGYDGFGQRTDSSPTTDLPGLSGVVDGALGFNHACAQTKEGRVLCWGDQARGQTGGGTPPRKVPLNARAAQVAAGADHSCARMEDGTLRCWGSPKYNQCGNGTIDQSVPGLEGVVDVRAGQWHTCTVHVDGSVRCWGNNTYGQIGLGNVVEPTPKLLPDLQNVVGLAAGALHNCTLHRDGTVRCWGNGQSLQTAGASLSSAVRSLSGVAALSGGYLHTCAVMGGTGTVRCWGSNEKLQLGWPSGYGTATNDLPGLSGFTSIATGLSHTCAGLASGRVRCWGGNDDGQTAGSSLLEAIPGLSGVSAVVSGSMSDHTCAVLVDGTLRCWGKNNADQTAGATPTRGADGLTGIVEVAVGRHHTCARDEAGGVSCWGDDSQGQVSGVAQRYTQVLFD